MKYIKKKAKRGIAMIELIFALVIIGIVLMSAPMLIQQTVQSNNVALQQEAIAAVSAHSNIILTKHWDEANANLTAGVSTILKTTNGAGVFDFNLTDTRNGIYAGSGRLIVYNGGVIPATAIGTNGGDMDDVDDYHGTTSELSIYASQDTTARSGDYIDVNLSIATTVSYIADTPTDWGTTSTANTINTPATLAGSSNIKFIRTVLSSNSGIDELDKNITLSSFSCNIGTTSVNGRDYP